MSMMLHNVKRNEKYSKQLNSLSFVNLNSLRNGSITCKNHNGRKVSSASHLISSRIYFLMSNHQNIIHAIPLINTMTNNAPSFKSTWDKKRCFISIAEQKKLMVYKMHTNLENDLSSSISIFLTSLQEYTQFHDHI